MFAGMPLRGCEGGFAMPSTLSRRTAIAAAVLAAVAPRHARAAAQTLLNASYDPTRELYRQINPAFAKEWQGKSGDRVTISQSHGGSGAQARAVLEGLQADVVTLALAADIDALARRALLSTDWASKLPDNACPYTSTIVFLVRKGNPKGIKDWPDLIRPDVSVITPNPKTSGGARWNILAALAWARAQPGATQASEETFLRDLLRRAPVMDTGARGATNSFVQRELGDVLIGWENEAWLARKEFGADSFPIVYPSVSVRAEPPVAVVDSVVDKKGTRAVATAYLEFLYASAGQTIIGNNYYRPRDPAVAQQFAERFPPLKMATVADFGGWDVAQKTYFADGGMFDRIFVPGK